MRREPLKDIGILLLLLYPAAADLKKREFYFLPVLAGAAVLFLAFWKISGRTPETAALLTGTLPGAAMFLLRLFSKKGIGSGDVLVLFLLGFLAGFEKTFITMFCAFLLTAGAGCILLLLHKAGRRTQLPFIPFLLAAFLIVSILERQV